MVGEGAAVFVGQWLLESSSCDVKKKGADFEDDCDEDHDDEGEPTNPLLVVSIGGDMDDISNATVLIGFIH